MSNAAQDKITISFSRTQWEDVISCIEAVGRARRYISDGVLDGFSDGKDEKNYFLKLAMRTKSKVEKATPSAEIINLNAFR